VLQQLAAEMGASATQVAIAWVAAQARRQGLGLVALAGARSPKQLQESLGALRLSLSDADLQRIEAAVPAQAVAGTRYDAQQMTRLDSER
jgi:aryl-alcohol dehydrogenase-like predicted oxidoreductase